MNDIQLPVGLAIDWVPVSAPEKRPLDGRYVRLESLDPARHAEDLFAQSADAPSLWTYMGYGPFADRASFRIWLEGCAKENDPLFYALVDRVSGRAGGLASYLRITPAMG